MSQAFHHPGFQDLLRSYALQADRLFVMRNILNKTEATQERDHREPIDNIEGVVSQWVVVFLSPSSRYNIAPYSNSLHTLF